MFIKPTTIASRVEARSIAKTYHTRDGNVEALKPITAPHEKTSREAESGEAHVNVRSTGASSRLDEAS